MNVSQLKLRSEKFDDDDNTRNEAVAGGAIIAAKVVHSFRVLGLNSRPPCTKRAVPQGPQATGW